MKLFVLDTDIYVDQDRHGLGKSRAAISPVPSLIKIRGNIDASSAERTPKGFGFSLGAENYVSVARNFAGSGLKEPQSLQRLSNLFKKSIYR